ncbi:MAG: cytochrome c oxidase subunit 3 [Parachlamydiales bacterium]
METTEANLRFGFWTYLMTDAILFGILFVTYAVLHPSTFGGPTPQELFSPSYALAETLLLLTSSFTSGLAMVGRPGRARLLTLFGATFLLGAGFLALEFTEFSRLLFEGNSWERSAFLSAYFTLVGTHGLHVTIGLLWMVILAIPIVRHGLNPISWRRLDCLRLFWHFLDVIWIFIFTYVYLMGAL